MHLSEGKCRRRFLRGVYLERADCTPDRQGNGKVFVKWSEITLGVLAFEI